MQDYSQLLIDKTDEITKQWLDSVIKDREIQSADHLSIEAIQDHINDVINAVVTVLAESQNSDVETLILASVHHGFLRAEQNFNPEEVVREYHLLRSIILKNLKSGMMQGSVEEAFRAISLINQMIDTAIAQCFKSYVEARSQELEQLQSELSLTVEQLKRLVRASQDNLSELAHELKTPLTSIIGYSDLFLRQSRLSITRDVMPSLEHIERVLSSGRRLLTLINDALELSCYEAGKLEVKLAPTDIQAVLNEVVEVMQTLADSRGLQLIVNCNQAPHQVTTDASRLHQILINLVSNAIRYTETGSIFIESRSISDQEWSIIVKDTGIGIDPEDQLRLFQPFERATNFNGKRPPDSTGLGLAIVERLVNLLQGRIYLASQVGEGSTFTVILPFTIQAQEKESIS
ncbi:ATPase [Hapalosiphon sp. MRB220]|nr:ATPase [Hapalosiphon sp. MRB220]